MTPDLLNPEREGFELAVGKPAVEPAAVTSTVVVGEIFVSDWDEVSPGRRVDKTVESDEAGLLPIS